MKRYFVRVTRDGGDSGDGKVKGLDSLVKVAQEGNNKAAQACVNMQANAVLECQSAQLHDRINYAVREVWRRSNQLKH